MIPNPTGYMLTSSSFAFIHLRYILWIPLNWSVILLKSPTSTGDSSNSTSSSVSNHQFTLSPALDLPEQVHDTCWLMASQEAWWSNSINPWLEKSIHSRQCSNTLCPVQSVFVPMRKWSVEIEFFTADLLQSKEDCTTRTTLPANHMHYGT